MRLSLGRPAALTWDLKSRDLGQMKCINLRNGLKKRQPTNKIISRRSEKVSPPRGQKAPPPSDICYRRFGAVADITPLRIVTFSFELSFPA